MKKPVTCMKVWALKNVVGFWMQINMMTGLIRAISYLSVCLTHMEWEGFQLEVQSMDLEEVEKFIDINKR